MTMIIYGIINISYNVRSLETITRYLRKLLIKSQKSVSIWGRLTIITFFLAWQAAGRWGMGGGQHERRGPKSMHTYMLRPLMTKFETKSILSNFKYPMWNRLLPMLLMAFENQRNCESSKDVWHSTFHVPYISRSTSRTYSVYRHVIHGILPKLNKWYCANNCT